MSDVSKKYKTLSATTALISFLLMFGPVIGFSISCLVSGALVANKVTLVSCMMIVLILTGLSLINKHAYRCRIFIAMIGIYLCIDKFLPFILIVAICQFVDELIVSPLHKSFRNKYVINRAIDKRN